MAPPDVSKRMLIQSAAAGLGAAALPSVSRAALQNATDVDVIIVGAGTAGLPAAIFAAERGASVLILERSWQLGGTLDRASGQIAGAGTIFQRAQGIVDTPQAHYDDIMRISRGTADPALVRLFVGGAGPTIDWLASYGFTIMPGQPILGDAGEPFTTRRYLWGPDGGRSILKVLTTAIKPHLASGRVKIVFRTRAASLILDNAGAVKGVVAETDGRRQDVRARTVLLTAGGCAANPAMFQALHKTPLYGRWAFPFSQGEGLDLGVSAGGYIRGGEKYLPDFGRILTDTNYPSPILASARTDPKKRPPWEIYVNARGERFMREDEPSPAAREQALRVQPDHRYWIVFDQAILDQAPPLVPTMASAAFAACFDGLHPMFARADGLDGLADKAGVPQPALVAAVASYNAGLGAGRDAMGRAHLPLAISKPPFYAVRQQGTSLYSFAGLAVDDRLQVVRQDGRPVPNLYAAGEIIGGGATGGAAHTSGMMAGAAVTFGRELGRTLLPV